MGEIKDILKSRSAQADPPPAYYPTGCLLLDMVLGGAPGCYGIRGGVLTGIFGINSAGKSFLMGEAIAASRHQHPTLSYRYQDIERRFRFNTLGLYGFQVIDPKDYPRPVETIEELDADLASWLDDNKAPAIYVVDSLDALSNSGAEARSEARQEAWEKDKEVEVSGDFGSAAKFLSQDFFKTKMSKVAQSGVALVFLSQVRVNLGGGNYGPKHKRTGGDALDHWCDTTLMLKVIHKIMVGDRCVGVVVEAKTTKSSTARPFRSCRYTLYFDYGIDDIGSNLDYLFDLRGEDGKLLARANEIAWSGKPKTLTTLKDFLEAHDAFEAAKRAKKADTGKGNLSLDWLLDWIPGEQHLADAFHAEFGSGLTGSKDHLIKLIEEDPKMRAELRQRVIDKWEAEEAALATNRRKKYT